MWFESERLDEARRLNWLNVEINLGWGPDAPTSVIVHNRQKRPIDWDMPAPEGYKKARLDIVGAWMGILPSLPFAIAHVAKMIKRELNSIALLLENNISDLAVPEDLANSSRTYRALFTKIDRLTQAYFLYNMFKEGKKVDWSLVTKDDSDLPILSEDTWKDLSKGWSKKMELMGKFENRAQGKGTKNPSAGPQRRKDSRSCYICQKKGHIAANCWYNNERGGRGGRGRGRGRGSFRGRGRGRGPSSQRSFNKDKDFNKDK